MKKTTFNMLENAGKPAPAWYRKLKRMVYLLLSFGGLLARVFNQLHIPAETQVFILESTVAVLELIGIGLANGEEYIDTAKLSSAAKREVRNIKEASNGKA